MDESWINDPRAYGLGTPSTDINFSLSELDDMQNLDISTAADHSQAIPNVPRNNTSLRDEEATAGGNDGQQNNEEPQGHSPEPRSQPQASNGPSASQKFPLSPPAAPVALDPIRSSSPATSLGDEDEFLDPLVLSARALRPNPSQNLKVHKDEDEDDDMSTEHGTERSSPDVTPRSSKSAGKQREKDAGFSSSSATPGASTRPGPKRKEPPPSSQPSPRPKQRLKDSHSAGDRTSSRPPVYHFHDSFLYLDGSVVIRIRQKQFKLHRTSLAAHGAWFAERFEASPDDTVGDTPVYILDGLVEELDFVNLLNAVDDAITYIDNAPDLNTIISILRAARNLGFAKFERWATTSLERMWSAQLDPLEMAQTRSVSNTISLSTRLPATEATAVVLLARECGLQTVLKRSLYELVRTNGFGQSDSSAAINSAILSAADHVLLVRARERLISLWMSVATSPFPPCPSLPADAPASSNVHHQSCTARYPAQDFGTYNKVLHGAPLATDGAAADTPKSLFVTYINDPLVGLETLARLPWEVPADSRGLGYCASCAQTRREFWNQRRSEWWEIFGQVVGC